MANTRRAFLRTAGLGAAAVGAAAVIPADAEAAAPSTRDVPSGRSMVVHVKDAKAGTIALFMGDREVVITDRALSARLFRALR
jgi:hypothetical protein